MDLAPAFEGLTEKQRLYVEARLRGMSQVASAVAAGASGDPKGSAKQYEAQEVVQRAIDKGRQISIAATGYTREKIAEMLQRAYDLAETSAEMTMAARELGRLHGVYAPTNVKVDHNHRLTNTRTEDDLRRLSTEELEKLAQTRGGDYIEGDFTDLNLPRLTDERERVKAGH